MFWIISLISLKKIFLSSDHAGYKLKEKIKIHNVELIADKYTLNASKNPKDIGPFPEYTIWYSENGELIKFQFQNWKDKKTITTQRSKWDN